jgi:hypothetical protein
VAGDVLRQPAHIGRAHRLVGLLRVLGLDGVFARRAGDVIASQMESAELERTTVEVSANVGPRRIDLRATGQVVKFDGFLAL